MDPIVTKSGTRILRPSEFKALINAVDKIENKENLEALLYTGARYSELLVLQNEPKLFKGNAIKMPAVKKKRTHNERYIRLNPQGIRAIEYFLRHERQLPAYQGWDVNLKRWALKAEIDPQGITVKTTRKTFESWLVTKYPRSLEYVFLSQGHNQMTALRFYLMLPFTDQDKIEMEAYTSGWI